MSELDNVRVMLVDDQDLVRAGLRMICDSEPGIVVVAEAGNGEDALVTARAARPDVVLMDVEMPVMNGIAATRVLTGQPDGPKVVILTTFERDDYIFEALQAGASGFLLKNTPPEELLAGIRLVASGAALLSPTVTRRVIGAVAAAGPRREPPPELGQLTEREREVLRAVGRGLSNAEVAAELIIGEATVKTHVSSVFTKLGLRDRVQAVVFAHEHGLVEP